MQRKMTVWIAVALLATGTVWVSLAAEKAKGPVSRGAADTSRVHVGTAGQGTDAYVVRPPGRAPAPAIVVIHEWWGLNDQVRGVARRLSQQGYVAIAPDLYHGKVAGDPELAHELMRGLEPGRALADLEAAVQWLRAQPRTAKSRVGVVGFCMGGGLSLGLALDSSEISAAVMFYGTPEADSGKLASLKAPLLGHFGADDQGIPVERVEKFREALKQAGKAAEIHIYPGAGHAFMNETRPSCRPEAARLAWTRTLAFFARHLKG